jgi:DNA repair protein RadA/Sms
MAKSKTYYYCRECGYTSSKWLGRCPGCGNWDTFEELKEENGPKRGPSSPPQLLKLPEVEKEEVERFSTGEPELDLVLGGGVVPGSLVLIGGSPGVGKSTLMLKVAGQIEGEVLYVAGEESPTQIKMRAERLGVTGENISLLPELELSKITTAIEKGEFRLVIVDSIQTLYWEEIPSAPGSISQIREVTFKLMRVAKELGVPIFIIGHITKEGAIAGPRVLEHMVDTVLYFEGNGGQELRILRAFKNRFGSTSEIALFEMGERGLVSAKNRTLFSTKPVAGSSITAIMEGSRPIVLEVQALVAESYGTPRRSTTGYDPSRLNMLLALLEKRLNLPLNRFDVFINVSGGIKINETGADLAVVTAILSSFRNRAIAKETLFIGEVSLVGDVRPVAGLEQRLKEAANLGFKKGVVPAVPPSPPLKCYKITDLSQLLEWM